MRTEVERLHVEEDTPIRRDAPDDIGRDAVLPLSRAASHITRRMLAALPNVSRQRADTFNAAR